MRGGKRTCTFHLRRSDHEESLFDEGSGPLVRAAVGLVIAAGVTALWLGGLSQLEGPGLVIGGTAAGVVTLFALYAFVQVTTRLELTMDRVNHRMTLRRKRAWGRWVTRWTVEAREVRGVLLQNDAVSLGMVDGSFPRIDSGPKPGPLKTLAVHISECLDRPLKDVDAVE
ncbi:MAG TPA: hypothetical protein VJU16_03315 [Planctomycetota bacterium]|nr:hypothetical protein [Planctomycetota bacterium]